MMVFGNLCNLPRSSRIVATAMETIQLYTPWVVSTAELAPAEGTPIVEEFLLFMGTGELKLQLCMCEAGKQSLAPLTHATSHVRAWSTVQATRLSKHMPFAIVQDSAVHICTD